MIVVYGTPQCSECKLVTSYLRQRNVPHEYLTIGTDINQVDLEILVSRKVSSVPVITQHGNEVSFKVLRSTL